MAEVVCDIQRIPLDRLAASPENARRAPPGDAAHAALKASLAAHGLLENLVARAMDAGPDGAARYAVVAGGRRLAALRELAREGAVAPDLPVPCRVVDAEAAPRELSLAENVVRVAMHPADQVEAFRSLADAGAAVSEIGARFGVSERTVERRLRLGGVAPELLDACRAGEIDLETLKAFSVATDRERQLAVWAEARDNGYALSAWRVKQALTDGRVPAESRLGRFVGVAAYEAAGGAVDRDLFAETGDGDVWLEDQALLRRLASEKLDAAAEELRTRWKWAEARLDLEWDATARLGQTHPAPGAPTDAERAEVERLEARRDEFAELDDDEWTEELVAESDRVDARLSEIDAAVAARAVFRPEDIAAAGCIVTVGSDGEMKVLQGLVKPEDMPARQGVNGSTDAGAGASGARAAAPGGGGEGRSVVAPTLPPAPVDPAAAACKEAGVGISLADDLRALRTAIVKAHLECDFEAAFDLHLFEMARDVFGKGYREGTLDVVARETLDRPPARRNDAAFGAAHVGEKNLAVSRTIAPLDWLEKPDAEAFAELRALPERKKRQLFASCVARCLKGQLAFETGARPAFEATVARLDIDFAAQARSNRTPVWSTDLLWKRMPKARLLSIAGATLGEAWALAHAKDRKSDLAAALEAAFDPHAHAPADVTAAGRKAALAWTPPGFEAFDTGRADDAPEAKASEPSDDTDAPSTSSSGPDTEGGTVANAGGVAPGVGDNDVVSRPEPSGMEGSAGRPGDADGAPDPAIGAGAPADAAGVANANGGREATAAPDNGSAPANGGGGHADPTPERRPEAPPPAANGHDAGGPGELPAFLRDAA